MAKKSKRNIKALIAKRQQLEALGQSKVISIPGAPLNARPTTPALAPEPVNEPKALPAYHASREIWRTLFSTAAIALVLVAIIVADSRLGFLGSFGETIYNALQLGS